MTQLAQKDPGVATEYGINFHDQIVFEAIPRTVYAQGVILYFARDSGFYYEVTTAGRTGIHYPRNLPRVAGQAFGYGSCVLTCRHPSGATIPTITAAWTVPTGITQASTRIDGLTAYITLTGGTDGLDYEITCRATPSAGNPIDKTILVQVRSQ